jgi:hypothetical protein
MPSPRKPGSPPAGPFNPASLVTAWAMTLADGRFTLAPPRPPRLRVSCCCTSRPCADGGHGPRPNLRHLRMICFSPRLSALLRGSACIGGKRGARRGAVRSDTGGRAAGSGLTAGPRLTSRLGMAALARQGTGAPRRQPLPAEPGRKPGATTCLLLPSPFSLLPPPFSLLGSDFSVLYRFTRRRGAGAHPCAPPRRGEGNDPQMTQK